MPKKNSEKFPEKTDMFFKKTLVCLHSTWLFSVLNNILNPDKCNNNLSLILGYTVNIYRVIGFKIYPNHRYLLPRSKFSESNILNSIDEDKTGSKNSGQNIVSHR